jgi:hypothetical protein
MRIPKDIGMTFIEILLANILSSLLLFLLLQLYLTTKSSFTMSNILGALQENTSFVTQVLTAAIQAAGLKNCDSNELMNQPVMMGYHGHIPEALLGDMVKNTDALVVRECDWQDQKYQYLEKYFFISNTNRKNIQGEPIYALYEKINKGNRQELVSNISDLRLLFGLVDKNGRNIQAYLTGDQINDWSLIKSARVEVILNSQETVLMHAMSQQITETERVNDKRLFKTWSFYAARRQ